MDEKKPIKSIYIAGPISNLANGNKLSFVGMAQKLEDADFIPLNPHCLPAGLSEPDYMDICFAMLRAADAVVMLDNWTQSLGATAEYHYALKLEKPIFYENDISQLWKQLNTEAQAA